MPQGLDMGWRSAASTLSFSVISKESCFSVAGCSPPPPPHFPPAEGTRLPYMAFLEGSSNGQYEVNSLCHKRTAPLREGLYSARPPLEFGIACEAGLAMLATDVRPNVQERLVRHLAREHPLSRWPRTHTRRPAGERSEELTRHVRFCTGP